jgi:hypothetical protein
MRILRSPTAALLMFLLAACTGPEETVSPTEPPPAASVAAPSTAAPAPASEAPKARRPDPNDPLRHQPDLPAERRAVTVIDGERRVVDAEAAVAAGYTLVDLSDTWTPFIFQPQHDAAGREMKNRYRANYLCLANDLCDEDGEALPAGEVNYLELFGIPPTLGVIRERVVADEEKACYGEIDYALIGSIERIPIRNTQLQKKYDRRIDGLETSLNKLLDEHGVDTLEELLPLEPKRTVDIEDVLTRRKHREVFAEVEKRLRCEGYLTAKLKHKDGVFDDGMHAALRRFQRRHKIYADPWITRDTITAAKKKPLEGNHDALHRALRERVVAAAHILEDGSTNAADGTPQTYTGADGRTHPVRDLVTEFTDAAIAQLGLETPEETKEFFERFTAEDFAGPLRGAVRFPALPEYYGPHMDLFLEIDRGDVYYDPPWHPKTGDLRYQHRKNLPKLTLYLTYNEQRFPLVRWPTTIGGWRAEQAANGYEYWRYKESDVGERVIRRVVAGPTWIPPETTPLRGLVKAKTVNGAWTSVVNYDEMGPGYLSAYGLVAGYFVVPGKNGAPDWDNGIRAHGSSDYMSIGSQRGYSHGCHRLLNHLAVRLYGFILNHRTIKVNGDQPLNASRQFLYKDAAYEIRVVTRGFEYELTPPLPVNVLEGNVKGKLRRPPGGYHPKPELEYPSATPPRLGKQTAESRAGGGGAETPAPAAEPGSPAAEAGSASPEPAAASPEPGAAAPAAETAE